VRIASYAAVPLYRLFRFRTPSRGSFLPRPSRETMAAPATSCARRVVAFAVFAAKTTTESLSSSPVVARYFRRRYLLFGVAILVGILSSRYYLLYTTRETAIASSYGLSSSSTTTTATTKKNKTPSSCGSNNNNNNNNNNIPLLLPPATSETTDFIYQEELEVVEEDRDGYDDDDDDADDAGLLLGLLRYCRVVTREFRPVRPLSTTTAQRGGDDDDECYYYSGNYTSAQQDATTKLPPPPPSNDGNALLFPYACQGSEYDYFAERLHEFSRTVAAEKEDADVRRSSSGKWGRRQLPFPGANRTVLFVGNSHTRQLANNFLCQYWHLVSSYRDYRRVKGGPTAAVAYMKSINSTVYVVINTVIVQSPAWVSMIEDLFLNLTENIVVTTDEDGNNKEEEAGPVPLNISKLDAMVVGNFNTFTGRERSNFAKAGREEAELVAAEEGRRSQTTTTTTTTTPRRRYTPEDLNFARNRPPNVLQIAAAYGGPIVRVSGFASYMQPAGRASQRQIQALKNRTNVRYLSGRKYVDRLRLECGGDRGDPLSRCHEPGDGISHNMRSAEQMHRCQGPQGGHPDLISWDVAEALHELMR